MIQRKQTLWLFLAALLSAGVFYFDLYTAHSTVAGVDTVSRLRVVDNFPSLLLALVMCCLPLISIFMFQHRKRQVNLTMISMVDTAGFMALTLWRVPDFISHLPVPPTSSNYWIGSVLPVIAFVFLILAIIGVRKDEKLVRSVDRLR
jgi:hypothetical protein